jgi:hypothetical protein
VKATATLAREVVMEDRATLSVVASRVKRAIDSHMEVLEYDAGFDGGEFSGPAHFQQMTIDARNAVLKSGWGIVEFEQELQARTSPKWVHESGLADVLYDPVEEVERRWEARTEVANR